MKFKGELLVILSAIGFSLMPVFAKTAYAGGANVTSVLLFRFILAMIFIWAYIFIKKIDFRLTRKQISLLFVLGAVFYSGTAIAIFNAYRLISGGAAQVLTYTYPAWVLILAALIFKEKISVNKVYAIILSMVGTTIVAYSPDQHINMLGVGFALVGAFVYALYVAFIDHGEFNGVNSIVMTGYIIIFTTFSFAVYGIIRGEISASFDASAWISISMLALFSTTIAILAFCEGAKKIGSTKASIVSTIEPISTMFFGAIFLGEGVTFQMVIGGVVIIMAILAIHLFNSNKLSV